MFDFIEECDHAADGQAHHVEVVALDARDPTGGVALDGVGAGLVEWLAGGDVGVDLVVAEEVEGDLGEFDVGDGALTGGDGGDAGHDGVGAAGEEGEHAGGVVRRLSVCRG